jgi:hypothetical protein
MGIMRRGRLLTAITLHVPVAILVAGCSSSRGNSADLLSITPNASATANVAYENQPLSDCTPVPEPNPTTESNLRFEGPCAFTQTSAVRCVNKVDDYYAYINRELPDYGQLSALVNVEKYKGPGTYSKNSVVFIQVSRKGVLYEWKQESATLTVTQDANKVIVGASSVPAVAGGPARGSIRVEGTLACRV